jgi:hypothetical protein
MNYPAVRGASVVPAATLHLSSLLLISLTAQSTPPADTDTLSLLVPKPFPAIVSSFPYSPPA